MLKPPRNSTHRKRSGTRKAWAISFRPFCKAASSLPRRSKTRMSFARAWRICGGIWKLYSVNHVGQIERRNEHEVHDNRQGEHHERWWRLETDFSRQAGAVLRCAAYSNQWPVRPDGGASLWLLALGGQVDGRSRRVAQTLPESDAGGL